MVKDKASQKIFLKDLDFTTVLHTQTHAHAHTYRRATTTCCVPANKLTPTGLVKALMVFLVATFSALDITGHNGSIRARAEGSKPLWAI